MSLDRDTVRRLREEFQAAIDGVAGRNGLAAMMGKIRFDERSFRCRLDVAIVGVFDAPKDAPDRTAGVAVMLGLPPDVVGRRFRFGPATYTVVGVVTGRPKYPVSATGPQGGRYKFRASNVLAGLDGGVRL